MPDLSVPGQPPPPLFFPPFPNEEKMRRGHLNAEAPLGLLGETHSVGRRELHHKRLKANKSNRFYPSTYRFSKANRSTPARRKSIPSRYARASYPVLRLGLGLESRFMSYIHANHSDRDPWNRRIRSAMSPLIFDKPLPSLRIDRFPTKRWEYVSS